MSLVALSRCDFRRLAVACALAALFAGCSIVAEHDGPPTRDIDVSSVPNAVPRVEPRSKYGNPTSYEVNGSRYYPLNSSDGYIQTGVASWYGSKFHGRRTSSGEIYDMYKMTAAHRTLPLPTFAEVTNIKNGRRAIVKVNDRGPFHANRIIDLSYAAAKKLGVVEAGTALVEVCAINPRETEQSTRARMASGGPLNFYLQFGAFRDKKNAERLHEQIDRTVDGLATVVPGTAGGKRIYRVHVGPLVSIDVADQLVDALARIGVRDHFVFVAGF